MSNQQYATVGKFHYYLPPDKKAAMREALRDGIKRDNIRENNLSADVVLENIWNAALDNK